MTQRIRLIRAMALGIDRVIEIYSSDRFLLERLRLLFGASEHIDELKAEHTSSHRARSDVTQTDN